MVDVGVIVRVAVDVGVIVDVGMTVDEMVRVTVDVACASGWGWI